MGKSKSIEDNIADIDEIIRQLEDKDTKLEDMFKLYESGMKKIKDTYAKIEKIEKDIQIISDEDEV